MTIGDVLEAHEEALRYGGLAGIRDLGLVESAIARPYSGYYRAIYAKAAALTHSLAKNHGFVDGNKRTTLLVLTLFLDRSGYRLAANLDEVEDMILRVARNDLAGAPLVSWFKTQLA